MSLILFVFVCKLIICWGVVLMLLFWKCGVIVGFGIEGLKVGMGWFLGLNGGVYGLMSFFFFLMFLIFMFGFNLCLMFLLFVMFFLFNNFFFLSICLIVFFLVFVMVGFFFICNCFSFFFFFSNFILVFYFVVLVVVMIKVSESCFVDEEFNVDLVEFFLSFWMCL